MSTKLAFDRTLPHRGVRGVAYNRTLIGALMATETLRRYPAELSVELMGAAVGLFAWFVPNAVGGGKAMLHNR